MLNSLTGKQKRYLRSLGNKLEPIIQIGKAGMNDNIIIQIEEALEARELIKGRLLPNYDQQSPTDVANEAADRTQAFLVQVVGRNFLLYRKSQKKEVITLPIVDK